MITRIHSRVHFECDGCGETLDTEKKDFEEARAVARSEMWTTEKIKDVWMNYCSSCADDH